VIKVSILFVDGFWLDFGTWRATCAKTPRETGAVINCFRGILVVDRLAVCLDITIFGEGSFFFGVLSILSSLF